MNVSKSSAITKRYQLWIAALEEKKSITKTIAKNLCDAFADYCDAAKGYSEEKLFTIFTTLGTLIAQQLASPYFFPPYHQKIVAPYNYEEFGKNFVRPLIDEKRSQLYGTNVLSQIEEQIKAKENVIFFANHQTELDPQILFILLEKKYPFLANNMTFVAGERVVKDPMAVPFSMGCSLFCIYSRKYIDTPPEKKAAKQTHNKNTLQHIVEALDQGGLALFLAPSGGRDRKEKNLAVVAPFEEKSIALFSLLASKAEKKTHFYPLSLYTYNLAPPPEEIQVAIGEKRTLQHTFVGAYFGKELDCLQKNRLLPKGSRAKVRDTVYQHVVKGYEQLIIDSQR